MTVIDLRDNILLSLALPLRRVGVYTGSALPIAIRGVPDEFSGQAVTGVTITLTNADGTSMDVACLRTDRDWTALVAASFFAAYGFISRGVKVVADVQDGSAVRHVTVGVGDLDVIADTAAVRRGDPDRTVQGKGDDIYLKSEVVDGEQHYKRLTIEKNPRVGWGLNQVGDYILVDGEFQEADQ